MKTAVNKLRNATKLTLGGTDFAFLTNNDWFTDASSSENYAKLIAKQDEFMELALKKVQTSLDISDGSTDAYIMTRLNSLQDASAQEHLLTLQSAAAIITLWKLQNNICGQGLQYKFQYNIPIFEGYTSSARPPATFIMNNAGANQLKHKFYLGNILIRPMIVKNIVVLSIVNILKTLKYNDPYSRSIVSADISDNNLLEKTFLIDKYASYLQAVSYQVTNDEPRDFLYMWGCGRGGFNSWYEFFRSFMDTVAGPATSVIGEKSSVEHLSIPQSSATGKYEMTRGGHLTGIFFKNEDKSREEILMKFMGESSMTGAYDKTAVTTGRPKRQGAAGGAAAGGAAAGGAASSLPAPPDIIGLLPYDEWDKPIAVFTPKKSATASTEPSPIEITFGKLLRKLSVEEIHYILHLTHVYKKLVAEGETVTPAPAPAPWENV